MEGQKGGLRAWFIMLIVLLAATAAPLAMFKVPTVMGDLCTEFSMNATQGGLVFSIFSLVPIFLAIPAGIIVSKYGNWKMGLAALACLTVGSIIGIMSTGMTPLLVSRIVEGAAMTLLATIGPNMVNQLFEPSQRGKAMGVYLCYMTLGQTVMFNVSPVLVSAFEGWRSVWWFTAIYSIVIFVLWVFVLRKADQSANTDQSAQSERVPMSAALKNGDVWLLTITFALFMIAIQSEMNFMPQYLSEIKGLDAAKATQAVGTQGIVGSVALVVSGIISDKLNSRKWMAIVTLIICGAMFMIAPFFPASMAAIVCMLIGFFANMCIPLVFAAMPEVNDSPETIGLSIGVLNTGQFVGTLLSSVLVGWFIDNVGWMAAFICMGVMALIGAVLMFMVKRLKR